ncbi:MAG TPA: alpha/beta fold hydrolase [Terriglobales bacterium]|nr:alpha/beta fold hydrolase [Terriglobales bacterium]
MHRARLGKDLVAEFWPPARKTKRERLILLCDGMPSMPRKQPLAEFLAAKGYWVFYPRWRGSWESGGQLLARAPQEDLSEVLDALRRPVREAAFGERFEVRPQEVFVIGGSFGGTAAILATLDRRVSKAVANCPVVDWSILDGEQRKETSNPNYAAYIREAFGAGYRLSARDWNKLRNGRFFSPLAHAGELDPSKILMYHAQDDPYVPWRTVQNFADRTGIRLRLFRRGGHLSTARTVPRRWAEIQRFFEAPSAASRARLRARPQR